MINPQEELYGPGLLHSEVVIARFRCELEGQVPIWREGEVARRFVVALSAPVAAPCLAQLASESSAKGERSEGAARFVSGHAYSARLAVRRDSSAAPDQTWRCRYDGTPR